MATCVESIERSGLELSGFNKSDSAYVLCRAATYCAGYTPERADSIIHRTVLQSRFGDRLEKAVQGGFRHVVSVDNAGSYAELWHKGGSWYAVTGAGDKVSKADGSDKGGIFEISGVTKGMPLREAGTRFLEAVFGPASFAKSASGCGCGK